MQNCQGYRTKEYAMPVKRYCQTLNLKDNPTLIAEYRRIHSKAEAWPEIREGIRSIGILEMEMYIYGNRVFMIVETPLDFDWEVAMEQLSHLPRQQEWEDFVARFQDCLPGSTSADKWKLMERMFYLYE
ncbi:L-rhamnose mutarotase [uncultured Bacteroides sp.]|uniref:L-rhamnose mutarotase n=1 Tax=uncultured Bacteroides sp. TaxID=162156 RepID=UPI002635809D|nr:L-rhamnose mutarotase [uncultured Bacteroides sp.]